MASLAPLLSEIAQCKLCEAHLALGPNPVVQLSEKAKILIIGQAPGVKVHNSGIPWDDASGKNLRKWMGISTAEFYDPDITAILPMGFCYPGKGKTGDLAPRKECAPAWHNKVLAHLKHIELTLLIGRYAQQYYLNDVKTSLTQTVKNFENFLPDKIPLPHPSPRNIFWQRKNPWFLSEMVPVLQLKIRNILQ